MGAHVTPPWIADAADRAVRRASHDPASAFEVRAALRREERQRPRVDWAHVAFAVAFGLALGALVHGVWTLAQMAAHR